MKLIYELAKDEMIIDAMETTSKAGQGIIPDKSLAISGDFWRDLRAGGLKHQTASGVICEVRLTGQGDFIEFSMGTDSGDLLTFPALSNACHYYVGRRITVDYFEHDIREPSYFTWNVLMLINRWRGLRHRHKTKTVLRMWLD